MSPRLIRFAVAAFLLVVLVLVLAWPEHMLNPGPMMKAHARIGGDCFACHTPLLGAQPERCVKCHALDRIGLFTTDGRPVANARTPSFHQHLKDPMCVACHGEHRGDASVLSTFSHDLLQPPMRNQCASCHEKPGDSMHRSVEGGCQQCHTQERWRPASFDHAEYFVLDRDHDVPCGTCHARRGDYRSYTCYGCHEHSPARIRAEHLEEGIRDFENCVECHRSAAEHGEDGGDDD